MSESGCGINPDRTCHQTAFSRCHISRVYPLLAAILIACRNPSWEAAQAC